MIKNVIVQMPSVQWLKMMKADVCTQWLFGITHLIEQDNRQPWSWSQDTEQFENERATANPYGSAHIMVRGQNNIHRLFYLIYQEIQEEEEIMETEKMEKAKVGKTNTKLLVSFWDEDGEVEGVGEYKYL